MENRTATLTNREKEVLRHVHALKTSTQIAHELNIAEVSVNKRIDSARRKLGGISRRQAALLLAQEEQGEGYENLIPSQIILNDPMKIRAEPLSERTEIDTGDLTARISAPSRRKQRNALDLWQRLGAIILAMAGLAAAASIYLALLRTR